MQSIIDAVLAELLQDLLEEEFMRERFLGLRFCVLIVVLCTWSILAFSQATISSGSIQGTVTDPSGAVVPGASVTISNPATGEVIQRTTSSQGAYSSGALQSGKYQIRVDVANFKSSVLDVTVQIGSAASGNIQLQVGAASQTVEVSAEAVHVNTEQATVQGTLNAGDIENMPVSGRNFLDLAQLEPGVQVTDGGSFDPTKNGFSSISFGSRAGRTARIELDGVDISDENVGTTTQNLSASAISEFQMEQSSLDISTELTSSGAVNVSTKSGTNAIHGEGFYLFRDERAGNADFPGGQNNYFQRNQFGASLGGAFVKDKLFYFVNFERIKQALLAPLTNAPPFTTLPSSYNSPFVDQSNDARLDYNGPWGMKIFYRFTYEWNSDVAAFGSNYAPFLNRDNTPSHGAGVDFDKGNFTHSFRYGHLKFHNMIGDAVATSGVFDPGAPYGVSMQIGAPYASTVFGPSSDAPQQTFQESDQFKYDGSWVHGKHFLRYGAAINLLRGGGYASFFGYAPQLNSNETADEITAAQTGPFPGIGGGDPSSNPLNYPVDSFYLGNGLGYNTEKPGFGLPGGFLSDHRIGLYVGDTWKLRPNLTLTGGLRYSRDTGRSDSDLAPITCSQIPQGTLDNLASNGFAPPCSGNQLLLNQFGPNLGGRVHNPNLNFGPQVGFVWDPTGSGKTVVRGGVGIFYENSLWNDILFDRPARLAQGLFNQYNLMCPASTLSIPSGNISSFPYNGGTVSIGSLCGQLIGNVAPEIAALQQYYQAQSATGGAQANGAFVGAGLWSSQLLAPNYKTAFSTQMNVGIQRELRPGMVLSVDFLRNVTEHYMLGIDTNHTGDARFFNKTAAQSAINHTLQACGVASIDAAILACPGLYPAGGGATIQDFAAFGLGGNTQITGGAPASLATDPLGNSIPGGFAFGGINPNVGTNAMYFPIGRATYTGLDVKLKYQPARAIPGFSHSTFQLGYSLSRFNTMTGNSQTGGANGDQDFLNLASDYNNPGRYYGPNALDRTSQISVGTVLEVAHHGPQISLVSHFFSPVSQTPTLVNSGNAGEIFISDVTGDGTVGDPLPGAHNGSFGRQVNGSSINKLIDAYNNNDANQLTPAGLAVVNSGVLTKAQMIALGAVMPVVADAPAGESNLGWLKTIDVRLTYPIHLWAGVVISPSISAFNAFNFGNFDKGINLLSGILSGAPGSINGTTAANGGHEATRVGLGSGVNTQGAPRQLEYGLRISF
jgi:hypothetical protein